MKRNNIRKWTALFLTFAITVQPLSVYGEDYEVENEEYTEEIENQYADENEVSYTEEAENVLEILESEENGEEVETEYVLEISGSEENCEKLEDDNVLEPSESEENCEEVEEDSVLETLESEENCEETEADSVLEISESEEDYEDVEDNNALEPSESEDLYDENESEELIIEETEVDIQTLADENAIESVSENSIANGKCGDDLIWNLDGNGTLTISGTGEMYDYGTGTEEKAPWLAYEIKTVSLEKGITSIGVAAFSGCTTLSDLKMPGVIQIKDGETFEQGAFYGCTSLINVESPSLKDIGKYAFFNCISISKLDMPEVTRVGVYAFGACRTLVSINIPKVKEIEEYAFYSCNLSAGINIPEVEMIGRSAFMCCHGLESINLPNIQNIEAGTFGESGLKKIDLPDTVTSIGSYAFGYCSELVEVNIPNSVTNIGEGAFQNCSVLRKVNIPDSVTDIGNCAFAYCSKLEEINIPDSIKRISDGMLEGTTNLREIMLPDSIESIGKYAFGGSYVNNITIPANVKEIKEFAFAGFSEQDGQYSSKSQTRQIYFKGKYPENGIDANAFRKCDVLAFADDAEAWKTHQGNYGGDVMWREKELMVSNLAYITSRSVSGYETTYSVLDKEKTMYAYGKGSITGLNAKKVVFIDTPIEIANDAFSRADQLESIDLPEGIKKIGGFAFFGCPNLHSIVIPSTVTEIGSHVFSRFEGYSGITKIFFRGDFPNLDQGAFGGVVNATCYYPLNKNWTEENRNSSFFTPLNWTWVGYDKMVPGEYQYNHDETCSSDGTETATCICGCGLTDTRTVEGTRDPNKHTYTNHYEELPDGRKNYYCDVCGEPKIAKEASGSCGDSLEWHIFDSNILVISGEGEMYDYDVDNPAPWSERSIVYCKVEAGVTRIGASAFADNTSLEKLVLADGLTEIGGYAFYGCSALTEIEMPKSVTVLDDSAFEGCTSLRKFVAYESLTVLKTNVFRKCNALTVYGYAGTPLYEYVTEKNIPFEILGYWGTCGPNMHWLLKNGELVVNGQGEMNNYSKSGTAPWSKLHVEKCIIEDNVTCIGNYAFSDMNELTEIQLPQKLTAIGEHAFYNCTGLTGMEVSENVKTIHDSAFEGCTSIEAISVSENLEEIGNSAFKDCEKLTDFVLPEKISEIKSGVFEGCTCLGKIQINGAVTVIRENAFRRCALKEIKLPEKLQEIRDGAFAQNQFTEIHLPASVEKLSNNAFSGCENLQNFTVDDGNPKYTATAGILFDKDGTELLICPGGKQGSFTIPRRTKSIGKYAFKDCKKITELVLPSGLEKIDAYAFQGMGISTLEIPVNVTDFVPSAIAECYDLMTITVDADNTAYASEKGILCDVAKETVIACPSGIETVNLWEGVSTIGEGAFTERDSDRVIDLPFSINAIDSSNAFGENTSFRIYDNARIKAFVESAGYKWLSKGDYALPWGNSESGLYHIKMAYDEMVKILKEKDGNRILWESGGEEAELVYANNNVFYIYSYQNKNSEGTLSFILTENGVYENLFTLHVTTSLGIGSGFTCTLRSVLPETLSINSSDYDYRWKIEREGYNNTSDADANQMANSFLYTALARLDLTLMPAVELQMKDMGFLAFGRATTTIHTITKSERIEATCTEDGMEERIWCSVCGAVEKNGKVIPATGHSPVTDPAMKATCTTYGKTAGSHCKKCGKVFQEQKKTSKLPHQVKEIPAVSPKCEKDGLTAGKKCSVCGLILQKQKSIKAKGHKWKKVIDVPETCGTPGKMHNECIVCGYHKKAVEIPASGKHVYGKYQIIKKASALQNGVKVRKCTICGSKNTARIPKLKPTISVNAKSISLKIKQSTSKIKVSGLAAGDAVASWKSSNPKIVTVTKQGKITAQNKIGSAVLTVTLKSGLFAKINVKVQKNEVMTTKILGVPQKISLKVKKKVALKPVLMPITSVQKITYTISDKKVAVVDKNGIITAKKAGKTQITVKAGNKKYVVTVTVK